MIISLPVSNFAKKIIQEEYGNHDFDNTIAIDPRDTLWKYLLYRLPPTTKTSEKAHTILTTTIDIAISANNTRRRPLGDLWQAGMYLHEVCRQRLLLFIEAQNVVGIPASRSIEIFYEIYDIDEDDYSRDSAYRLWQRHSSEKRSIKKIKKWGANYAKNTHQKKPIKKPLTPEQVQTMADKICRETLVYWFTSTNAFRYAMVEQLLTYIYIYECGSSREDIARRSRIHRRTVDKRLRKWQDIMDTTPSIHRSYHKWRDHYTLTSPHDHTR